MAAFSAQSISRPPLGRPLNTPTWTFAALLYGKLTGNSRRRAEEILQKNPDAANGAIWSVAANAAADGIKTAEQFQEWLQRESTSQKQSPSL
jgi:hypothetical protein